MVLETSVIRGTTLHDVDIKIYKNPTLSQVMALSSRFDLRGICDGKNIFVYDANLAVHYQATQVIFFNGDWEGPSDFGDHGAKANFYIYNEALAYNAKYKEEWYKGNTWNDWSLDGFELGPNTILTIYKEHAATFWACPRFFQLVKSAKKVGEEETTFDKAEADKILASLTETISQMFTKKDIAVTRSHLIRRWGTKVPRAE